MLYIIIISHFNLNFKVKIRSNFLKQSFARICRSMKIIMKKKTCEADTITRREYSNECIRNTYTLLLLFWYSICLRYNVQYNALMHCHMCTSFRIKLQSTIKSNYVCNTNSTHTACTLYLSRIFFYSILSCSIICYAIYIYWFNMYNEYTSPPALQ